MRGGQIMATLAKPRRCLVNVTCSGILVIYALKSLSNVNMPKPRDPCIETRHSDIIPSLMGYPSGLRYLLNSGACSDVRDGPIEAVIVVHTDPRHPELRQAIRRSLPQQLLVALRLRRVFMVGDASTAFSASEATVSQATIADESRRHGDVVQGNFHDSYYNMTYKHIMALEWAGQFCSRARLIVKMDDDIVYDVLQLLRVLRGTPDTSYIGGRRFAHSKPYRAGVNKWSVTYDVWPRQYYPPYLSGWLYVVTPDVARRLVLLSGRTPFFWIDDTYVTGMLTELHGVNVSSLSRLFVESEECVRLTSAQTFGGSAPAGVVVYRPNFVVGPSGKRTDVVRRFNALVLYCDRQPCTARTPDICPLKE